jgi:hypothetical protein
MKLHALMEYSGLTVQQIFSEDALSIAVDAEVRESSPVQEEADIQVVGLEPHDASLHVCLKPVGRRGR